VIGHQGKRSRQSVFSSSQVQKFLWKREFSRADRGVHPQYKREREKEWLRNRLVPSGLVELLLGLSPNNLRRLRKWLNWNSGCRRCEAKEMHFWSCGALIPLTRMKNQLDSRPSLLTTRTNSGSEGPEIDFKGSPAPLVIVIKSTQLTYSISFDAKQKKRGTLPSQLSRSSPPSRHCFHGYRLFAILKGW